MITITFERTSLDSAPYATYEAKVWTNPHHGLDEPSRLIACEMVEGHNRADGWMALLHKLVYNSSKPGSQR